MPECSCRVAPDGTPFLDAIRVSKHTRNAFWLVALLTALRFATAANLPLSFDEAYFWLWSKHLAVSYYDHPPMIALAIRLGTVLFGDNEFGVRFVPLLASVAASWAVWRSASILFTNHKAAATAACFFNATLMVAADSMSATPDSLVLAAASFLMLAFVKLEDTGDGRWWLAAGLSLGAAFLMKYTAFFLTGSVALWLFFTPQGRGWLRSPWPYLGGAIALVFLIPNLIWNSEHDWISFRFQFGRIVEGGPTFRYLAEFVGGQLTLASPFIMLLGAVGLVRETRASSKGGRFSFPAAIIWPAFVYFAVHALHDRVQGNWPSFIYPAFIIFAASAVHREGQNVHVERALKLARLLAMPVALAILTLAYLEAFVGILPMGKFDPVARMTAVGIGPVTTEISSLVSKNDSAAIATSRYITTGWLAFYLRPRVPIIQLNEGYRWLEVPHADTSLLNGSLLYVTQEPDRELSAVTPQFTNVKLIAKIPRMRAGVVVDNFYVYRLSGFHGAPLGWVL